MKFRRWSPLTFVSPARYVDTGEFWSTFDLESWSRSSYTWTQDPWNGYRDFARHPRDTVDRGRGDCEDYALVALSWGFAHDREGLGLGLCWEWPYPWPTHVIAFDDECVYSSGEITTESVDAWADDSRYDFVFERQIN